MVTDKQVLKLFRLIADGRSSAQAAVLTNMDEKTARKYRKLGKRPSEVAVPHTWRTRPDPFAEVWPMVCELLELNPGLQAKTIFAELQRQHPGRFADVQLRTLQRRIRRWRGLHGPAKEVFFAQEHEPGRLAASDFTSMNEVGVTIAGQRFDHLVYHFVLTYSNWEWARICFSESFESLSEGLQDALLELGAAPERHRTDRMSLAVSNATERKEFTQRYQGLMTHYGMAAEKIQAGRGNENGDVEQRHHRFRTAVDQALMLRGSRDFASREEYAVFLRQILTQLNAGRVERLAEERSAAGIAGEAVGSVQEGLGAGRQRQSDPCRAQHLRGAEPADRPKGRGPPVRRAPGGVVRANIRGALATVAWPGQAPHQLPVPHRLAGAQARRLRALPLPSGAVSVEPLPHGLRRVGGTAAGAGRSRVSADPAVGGPAE
jgi:hypothetical protein